MGFNKKVLSKAVSELGKAKAPAKPKDIITDPAGQWKYPGQKTRIPGNDITMQGVNYPVWGQPNVGKGSMMQPGQNYLFPEADYVDETPMAKKGGALNSKKYSKSMSATNKLFAKNKLFKNMKSKIFDPNSKFKSGGSKLGPINLDPNPLSHYELNYGFNLPTKQDGGLYSNPWLYTYNQQSEDREPGQVIGLGADFQHKSGLHGSTNVELPFFNKNAMGNLYSELGYGKRFKNFDADATLKNYTEPGSKFNPSFTTGVGYNKNLGDHINFSAGVNNTMVPGKLFKPGVQAGLTYRFQEGGENDDEYMDLTDEEIQAYRDAGYEVDELPHAQDGGPQNTAGPRAEETSTDVDAMNAMMKARMATDAEFSNPAAQRMTSPYPKTGMTPEGLGTHYMASMGNQAVPLLQDKGGDELEYNENPPPSNEDMNFRTPEEAQYFAEHYKEVAPMMKGFKEGGYVQHELVKAQTGLTKKPLEIADPNKYAFRKAAYDDSLKLYNKSINDLKGMSNTEYIKAGKYSDKTPAAAWSQVYINSKKDDLGNIVKGKIKPTGINYSTRKSDGEDVVSFMYQKPVQPVKFVPKKNEAKPTVKVESNKVDTLPLKSIERFTSSEQTIIPARPYVKAIKPSANKGVWSDGSDGQYPKGLSPDDFTRKNLEYQERQRGVKQPVSQIRKDGGALDSYQKKGEVKTFKRDIRDQDALSNTGWSSAPVEKKKVQPTAKQKQAQKSFDKNFKVTDKSKYEKTEDKITKAQQDLKDWGKENGVAVTDSDLENVANQQWSFAGVGPQKQPDIMQATPEQSNSSRAWEYITNPMTAAEYAISGGGAENMPHNINEMKAVGYDPGVVQGRNLVGNTLNGLNLFDDANTVYKGINDIYKGDNSGYATAGLGLFGFLPGGSETKGIVKAGNIAHDFAGPLKHSHFNTPEVLKALGQRGKNWDKVGIPGKDLLHKDMIKYHGTYHGRPIVEVKMPDGSSEMFYKSSGWADKAGEGLNGTTEGMWQVYGGHAHTPKSSNWFIKDDNVHVPGLSYKDYYGSNTFRSMADNMDNALIQKHGFADKNELDNALNFKNRHGKIDTFTPKEKFGGSTEEWEDELDDNQIERLKRAGYTVDELDEVEDVDTYQAGGPTVSQLWKEHTGTDWSEAHRQGLTSGSYADNMKLRDRILNSEFDNITPGNNIQQNRVKSQNHRDAYVKNVQNLINNNKSLDDLVSMRMGTREGLLNLFPNLGSAKAPVNKPVANTVLPVKQKPVAKPIIKTNRNMAASSSPESLNLDKYRTLTDIQKKFADAKKYNVANKIKQKEKVIKKEDKSVQWQMPQLGINAPTPKAKYPTNINNTASNFNTKNKNQKVLPSKKLKEVDRGIMATYINPIVKEVSAPINNALNTIGDIGESIGEKTESTLGKVGELYESYKKEGLINALTQAKNSQKDPEVYKTVIKPKAKIVKPIPQVKAKEEAYDNDRLAENYQNITDAGNYTINTFSKKLSGVPLGVRNREDERDIKGKAIAYTYAPFKTYNEHLGNSYGGISLKPNSVETDNQPVIVYDNDKMYIDTFKNQKNTGKLISPTYKTDSVTDLVIDKSNRYSSNIEQKMIKLKTEKGDKDMPIGTADNSEGSFKDWSGGHLMLENPKTKEVIVIHGKSYELQKMFRKFLQENKLKSANIIETDHKSYSLIKNPKNNILTGEFNRARDNANTKSSGSGNFIYSKI